MSATDRFPTDTAGLPDRCDLTIIDAFDDAWLLISHTPDGAELVGVAADDDAARVWLLGQDDAAAD